MGKLTAMAALCAVSTALLIAAPAASAQTPAPSPPPHSIRAFGLFKIVGCVFALGGFIAGNTALILKVKRLGGIVKFAKRLWHAKSAEKRAQVVFAAFGTLSGTAGLIASCTP
jgi:hypothetical protein